jgi:UDP-GlcNAc:undecaprenyl-phosphate GlcNAc-1-phosphate transferase
MLSVVALAAGLAGALVLTPLVRELARLFGVMDHADGQRKLQKQSTPLLGGVALHLTLTLILFAAAFGSGLERLLVAPGGITWTLPLAFGLAATLACLVGCADDVLNLRVRYKLLGQFLATLPIAASGIVWREVEFAGWSLDLGLLAVPVTILWIMGSMNAFNFLDGMDGLASTVGACTLGVIGIVSIQQGQIEPGFLALVLSGSLVGFLIYNLPPASVYLGEAGSTLIGLATAVLALRGAAPVGDPIPLFAPLALMSLPLADMGLAVLRRSIQGDWVWKADRGHIHHVLQDHGLSVLAVLGVLAGISLVAGSLAFASVLSGHDVVPALGFVVLYVVMIRRGVLARQELRLVSERVHPALRAVALHLAGGAASTPPTFEALESVSFDQQWQQLLGPLERLGTLRLEVETGQGALIGQHAVWASPTSLDDASIFEIAFESPSSGWSRLRASIAQSLIRDHLAWNGALSHLQHFGRFWADHPQLVPPTPLRLVRPEDQAGTEPGTRAA